MAPSGKYTHTPNNLSREPPPSRSPAPPLHPNPLIRKYRTATPTPTPLTRQQIEYLVAKASAKTQTKNEPGVGEPWTAVPDPVPDTGDHPGGVKYSSFTLSTSSVSSPLTPNHVLPFSTYSTLPLLTPSLASTGVITAIAHSTSVAPVTVAENQTNPSTPHLPHRLPLGAVSLIAIAGACLLLVLIVTIKLCMRPTRRPLPVPSRPILADPFPEDDAFQAKLEDSPVFGGQERLSERPGYSGLWQWTQYSATPATTAISPSTKGVTNQPSHSRNTDAGKKIHHPFANGAHSVGVRISEASLNSTYPEPVQQVPSALTRAASRLSVASASLYPGSPSRLVTSFTADGHPVVERANAKVLRRSKSSTIGERSHMERPQSRSTRYSCGFAYDGAEVMSPKLPMQSLIATAPITPGRTRIMSSYYAHSRASAVPHSQSTEVNIRQENPHATSLDQKSDSHRERDALGFGSRAAIYPSSPQPTLYPDDSLSVVDAKRQAKQNYKTSTSDLRASRVFGRDEHTATSLTPDATAALGSLMLMDFGGTKQNARNVDLTSTSTHKKMANRSDDKPPRVPSPPPLPSLTQMGLEQVNPEAYAEYRSPTYSIYNLYEDRKSRA
ncbi:hypothetical protein GGX14DRAFT_21148 [Mycena pura]|uniref:Uncharacterized protein n=1 Tax=Mycena pura TaxID=153505 RepID=A0AAD6VSV2_9AGAR|nr:hypothetical protein GGX14DRAFT_21148 [Mycena pura]